MRLIGHNHRLVAIQHDFSKRHLGFSHHLTIIKYSGTRTIARIEVNQLTILPMDLASQYPTAPNIGGDLTEMPSQKIHHI
ncbi:MAG: hypothetical protein ACI8WB_006229 [Phenylobacterium sp.]|jgi:hypothetical protein